MVTNLIFPTAMTFGPDGALYVANYGNESNRGEGQILRVLPGTEPAAAPDVTPPKPGGLFNPGQKPERRPLPPGTVVGARVTIIEGSSDPKKWGYDPSTVTIKVGAAVEFTNRGSMPHSATHTRGAFDTGMLEKGESVSIRLDDPDTYEYFCHPHPWMKGKIVVEGPSRSGAGAEPGGAAPEEPPPPAVNLWWAGGFVGLLLAAILAAGVAMRRPHRIAAGEWGNTGATGRPPVAANGGSAP